MPRESRPQPLRAPLPGAEGQRPRALRGRRIVGTAALSRVLEERGEFRQAHRERELAAILVVLHEHVLPIARDAAGTRAAGADGANANTTAVATAAARRDAGMEALGMGQPPYKPRHSIVNMTHRIPGFKVVLSLWQNEAIKASFHKVLTLLRQLSRSRSDCGCGSGDEQPIDQRIANPRNRAGESCPGPSPSAPTSAGRSSPIASAAATRPAAGAV